MSNVVQNFRKNDYDKKDSQANSKTDMGSNRRNKLRKAIFPALYIYSVREP